MLTPHLGRGGQLPSSTGATNVNRELACAAQPAGFRVAPALLGNVPPTQLPLRPHASVYEQPHGQAYTPSDYDLAPRTFPALHVDADTASRSSLPAQSPRERHHQQQRAPSGEQAPLSGCPSLPFPLCSPLPSPAYKPAAATCLPPRSLASAPLITSTNAAPISSQSPSHPSSPNHLSPRPHRQDFILPLTAITPTFDLLYPTQPIHSPPFTAHSQHGHNDAADNNGMGDMHMGNQTALFESGGESSFVVDEGFDGSIADGFHYQQNPGDDTGSPSQSDQVDSMSMSLFESVIPAQLALDKVVLSPILENAASALAAADSLPPNLSAYHQREQQEPLASGLHTPVLQSPLQDQITSQQFRTTPHATTPHRSSSSEMTPANMQQGASPSAVQADVPAQVPGQQQQAVSGAEPDKQAAEGGKIWDLFPAITPQLQAHHLGGGASPLQADAQNHQQQQQMQMQHATYQQQQAQQHYAEFQQQHAYASWAQTQVHPHYVHAQATFDGSHNAGVAEAIAHADSAAPPVSHANPHILPGAQLGATIQHLLPPPTIDHSAGMAQGDLMSLFVPSLMLPGYPRQVPVSESLLTISPVSESSAGGFGAGKKGGGGNKGVGGSAHSTPRLAAVQVTTVPPPAPAMVSVPVPRGAALQGKDGAQAELQQTAALGEEAGPSQQHEKDYDVTADAHHIAQSGSNDVAGTSGWHGMDLGIGVGLGLGPGLAEQTSWQTLPENALNIAQPSSFRAVFDMSAFPSFDTTGVPMTPFTGAEWLNWPDTPLKTALKSANANADTNLNEQAAGATATAGHESSTSAATALPNTGSEDAKSPPPRSARFVSIPLYTVPGSAIDGSTNTEPTLALPPGVHVPTDAPMTGWIFDTADVGSSAVTKGLKRKRGERGRPRGTFSSYRPATSPMTPGSAGPIASASGLQGALDDLVRRSIADVASIVNRCGVSALPSETIGTLRAALDKASAETGKARIESLKRILDQLSNVVEMLPPLEQIESSHQTPSAPSSGNRLSIETQAFSPATATTLQSAPSARVPWEEMTLPFTSSYQTFGMSAPDRPLGMLSMSSAPAPALPQASAALGPTPHPTRPPLTQTKSMPPPISALPSARSPPATGDSMWSMSSTSSGHSTGSRSAGGTEGKRFTGAWTADEVERITRAAKECKMCLSSGEVVVDWKAVIRVFGETRSKHQILVKAVELGLKDTTTSSNRRKKQRKHQHSEGTNGKPPAVHESKSKSAAESSSDNAML